MDIVAHTLGAGAGMKAARPEALRRPPILSSPIESLALKFHLG